MRQLVFVLLLFGASGCFLLGGDDGGEDEPTTEDECNDAKPCPGRALCSSDRKCVPVEEKEFPTGTYLPGDGASADHCRSSDDCGSAEIMPTFLEDTLTSADGAARLCTIGDRSCEGGSACRAYLRCVPPEGEREGGLPCETGADCSAGLCVRLGPPSARGLPTFSEEASRPGTCLRVCQTDADCPALTAGPEERAPVGLVCRTFEYGNRFVGACLPPSDEAPRLCGGAGDCDDGACTFAGRIECRREKRTHVGIPGCAPRAAGQPDGATCASPPQPADGEACTTIDWAPDCASGLCAPTCLLDDSLLAPGRTADHSCQPSFPDGRGRRCASACRSSSDCGERLTCVEGTNLLNVGQWVQPEANRDDPNFIAGRPIRYCGIDRFGCLDEFDCRSGSQHPLHGLLPDGREVRSWDESGCPRRCMVRDPGDGHPISTCEVARGRVEEIPADAPGCVEPDPPVPDLLPPGATCDVHAQCDTGLCARLEAAVPGRCAPPCDPLFGARCGLLADLLPGFEDFRGSTCTGVDYAPGVTVHACL